MKKGFTIIEVIIAIAVLLIGVTAINAVYNSASQLWRISEYKANTAALNQAVSQRLRAEGKRNIEIIKTNADKLYLYFDTTDDVNTAIDSAISNTPDASFSVVTLPPSFADCKLGTAKKYGALVQISDVAYTQTGVTNPYKLYKCSITVWNLSQATEFCKSDSVFYIGR